MSDTLETVRIIKLGIENVKRIKVAYLEFPDGPGIHIFSGKNRQGKSSILDAIWCVLGGKRAVPGRLLREGEKEGRAVLELSNGLVAERRFRLTADGDETTDLTVKNARGVTQGSPDTILKRLFEPIAADPKAFMDMDTKAQYEEIRGLISGVDWDFEERMLDDEFRERTDENRELERLKKHLASLPRPATIPDKRRDPQTLMKRMERASEANNARASEIARKAGLEERQANGKREVDAAERRLKAMRDELAKIDTQIAEIEIPDEIDLTEIRKEMSSVTAHNEAYDAGQKIVSTEKQIGDQQAVCDKLTASIEARRERLRKLVEDADLPIPGLSIADKQVFYQGLPLKNAAEADQLTVSTAIAISKPMALKACFIREGNDLDSDSLKLINDMMVKAGFVCFMQKVDESGEVGIVLVDGQVVSTPGDVIASGAINRAEGAKKQPARRK